MKINAEIWIIKTIHTEHFCTFNSWFTSTWRSCLEKTGRKRTNVHRASLTESTLTPLQHRDGFFFQARVVKCDCTRIKLILSSRHKTQEMRRVTTSWPTPSSVPHRSPTTVFIKLRSKPLTTTEEEEEPVWRLPASPFMCSFNCAAISPHLLLSRWADRYGTTCIYTPPGRLRRSLCSPPVLSSASSLPVSLSLSLSICLVNMCKQTSRGIDKTHPGVFISASSGQNMTPPPLKMISSVVFFPKRDLGDRLLPPSRVHSLYLV